MRGRRRARRRRRRPRAPAARSSSPRRDRIDLLVNNASVLGPSPQPALARLPARASCAASTRSTSVAPLALVQLGAAEARAGRAHPQRDLRRRRRALRGLGRLRLVQGGAGPASAAILAAEHPELRVYAVDPGDMRTQMHQEAFPGEDISDRPLPEDSVPGLLGADRGRPAERPLPRPSSCAGARRDGGRAGLRAAGRAGGATSRPRRAACAATRCACWWPTARDGSIEHARFRELPAFLAPGDLLVVEHLGHAARGAARGRRTAASSSCTLSTPAPDAAERAGGVVELRRRRRALPRTPAPASGCRLRRRRPRRAPRALRGRSRACGSRALDAARAARLAYLRRHGRPIRYRYVPREWPLEDYQTAYALRARQRGDAERRTAVHAASWSRALVARRRHRGAAGPAHGRLVARARRAAVPRALPRARGDRAAGQRRARLGRRRHRGGHHRGARPGDRRRARRQRACRRGLDRPACRARRAACARSTG